MSSRAHKPITPAKSKAGRHAKPLQPLNDGVNVRRTVASKADAKSAAKGAVITDVAQPETAKVATEQTARNKARQPLPESKATPVLPASISSPQDLGALILELHNYTRWASHANIKLKLKQDVDNPPPPMSPTATEMLHLHSWANDGAPLDAAACEQLIHQLEHLKASAPTVTITLAAPATKQIKTKLVDWCRKNIDPGVLVNFQFNGTLLGGMVVRFGSHIYDWSFRQRLMDNRGNFGEVLRRV